MTCIVAIRDATGVTMGADSAGSDGYRMIERTDSKVFTVGEFLIGFTTSFRMGQVLRYDWHPPSRQEGLSTDTYLVRDVIRSIRDALKSAGFAQTNAGEEQGGEFLLAYRGDLYFIGSDYQVGQHACGFASVGCGREVAMGAMQILQGSPFADLPTHEKVRRALAAAETLSAGVRGPFTVLRQDAP